MKSCRTILHATFFICLSTGVFGCGTSGANGGAQQQPHALTVISVTPSSVTAGSPATTVTVTGTGFTSSTVISVNGTAETTTFVSSTQLTAVVPAGQIASGGNLSVTANDSGTSSSATVSLVVNNPTPTIAQVSPAAVVADAGSATLTLTGTNFVPTTTVQVNGSSRTTTFQSATQISATLTASDLVAGGTLAITAVSPVPSGGTSASAVLTVNNPVPTVLSASPGSLIAGATAATTVTLNGSNFVPTSIVNVGGSPRTATFVNAGQITFQLATADQASAGSLPVSVVNPVPGGGTSSTIQVAVNNPSPGTITLSPSSVPAGSGTATTVTVSGSNFVSSSVIQVNGSSRPTTFASSSQLTFQLTATDKSTAGSLAVTVVNPAPGGGTSAAQTITISPSTFSPHITLVSPNSLYVGQGDVNLTVQGTNFASSSVVEWNGTALQTSFSGSSTVIGALVPAALLSAVGSASVNVYTPTSNPQLSNTYPVGIVIPGVPSLTSLSANAGPIRTETTLRIAGGPFIPGSTVSFNGASVPSNYIGTHEIDAVLPAVSIPVPGNYTVSVTTPAPGGGTSNTLTYLGYIGLPNNSMIYNPTTGLLYASVPGSAGAPYGNSIVSVDPATGALGTPIFVGSEPDKLALTADGRYLWVGLDGAAAVRKVDLVAGTPGLQFSLPAFVGYNNELPVLALAAVPGASDSVIVATSNNLPAIYDAGILRGAAPASCGNAVSCVNALYVDGSRNEVYAAAGSMYYTYTYGTSGLTALASTAPTNYYDGSYSFNENQEDEFQILSGTLYSDFGSAYNAETGAPVGIFHNGTYADGTPAGANGPEVADALLGKIFYLDGTGSPSCVYNQIASYKLSDYTVSGSAPIPMPVVGTTPGTLCTYASRLTRWGSNGLAFRTAAAIYSIRSNSVNDLSAANADLSMSVAAGGGTATGGTTTYTATVTNSGPAASTNVVFTAQAPATGTVVSATFSGNTCSITGAIACDLGGMANGASATVTVVVNQLTAGASTITARVTGSENDPNLANNQASATVTITGSTYSPVPVATSLTPTAILAGSSDTTITVTGSGFTSASTVLVGGTPAATSYVSSTKLNATVPTAQLTTLGWTTVSVSNAAPGGGTSVKLPLSIFSVIAAGANHIAYDPYTRKVMASIGSGANANSIVALTPENATLGTPIPIGSGPSGLALSPDGQIMYVALTGDNSVARFNMVTQQPDFTVSIGAKYANGSPITFGGIAVQPGTEDTIALNLGAVGTAIYDFNTTTKTAALRGQANDRAGVCPQFLDANDLLATSAYSGNSYSSTLIHWTVPSGGFAFASAANETTTNLNGFVCVIASGGLAYGSGGVTADPSTSPATIVGTFPQYIDWSNFNYDSIQNGIPDTSLKRSFFITTITEPCGPCSQPGGITAYDQNTFLLTDVADMKMVNFEGSGTNYTGVDLVRWGQDGLAALTTSGRIYLLRGPVVVPQELNTNSAAVLTSSSPASLTHGSGNMLLTVTGSGFLPGVAVTWNGSYRTTTYVSATQLTVAIAASDLASAGTASLIAVNPGSSPSSPVTLNIN